MTIEQLKEYILDNFDHGVETIKYLESLGISVNEQIQLLIETIDEVSREKKINKLMEEHSNNN